MGRLIDADVLLKDIRDNSQSYFADDFAKEWVDRQPTVHPEQHKTGKWLYRIGWIGAEWICSECGERTVSAVMGKPRYIYCPMCGAKMEG